MGGGGEAGHECQAVSVGRNDGGFGAAVALATRGVGETVGGGCDGDTNGVENGDDDEEEGGMYGNSILHDAFMERGMG